MTYSSPGRPSIATATQGVLSDPSTDAASRYLRIDNLSKSYGALTVTRDISLHLGQGETLALLGPSGCGKTTILRCVAGLETPNGGRIEIGGRAVYDSEKGINVAPEHRDLGVVFQSYAVWPHLTVEENVGFPLKVRKLPAAEVAERAGAILDLVGLTNWRKQSAALLSGGQQQRIALARALIHHPAVVLFDEPMSNLDARLRDQMRIELKLLRQRLNFTSVYVTHDQSEAFSLADQIVIMNKGHIEARGGPRAIASPPATPFVASFFGYNVLSGVVVAAEPGAPTVTVQLAPDFQVTGIAGSERFRPGQSAVLCLRKESVRLSPAGAAVAGGFAGTVLTSSYQWQYEEHLVSVHGVQIKVVRPPSDALKDVVVSFDADQCFVLPADG